MTTLRKDFAIGSPLTTDIILSFGGAIVILLATQIAFYRPDTPVPITGQTFGVLVAAMLLGRKRGVAAVAMYLTAGALGAPVFASFSSVTAFFGPTSGYLLAFLPMAFVAGWASEKGLTKSLVGGFATGLVAHTVVLLIGTAVLAAFVGVSQAWMMGVAPFLIGDVVKSSAAALMVWIALRSRGSGATADTLNDNSSSVDGGKA